ncbi:MAG: hypothetical protein IPK07_25755 [Deltaproteobacteria bacterium]|nr:hypothetical protein [Deltaproteobacteria bacterium]
MSARWRRAAGIALAIVATMDAASAHARPTHGTIEPLPAGTELDGLRYLPLEVGRTATFHDGAGNRYRQIVTSPSPVLAADQKIRDRLRRRLVYEMPANGGTRLIERRILEIDPARGVIARPDEAETGGDEKKRGTRARKGPAAPARQIEIPARLGAGTSWTANGIEHRFQGVADVQVEAGSFQGCAVVDAKERVSSRTARAATCGRFTVRGWARWRC